MFFIPIQLDFFRQLTGFTIDPYPDIAILADLIQDFQMLAFFPPDHRRQQGQLRPFSLRHQDIHHLLDGLLGDRLPALRTMWAAYPGIQQTQVIVHFRNRSHCRTRITARGFLIDGNSGR